MEIFSLIYHKIEALGIHRYGWWFIAAVMLIPGIVGVNLCQFYLTQFYRGEKRLGQVVKPLCLNLLIALASAAAIIIAVRH